MESPTAIDNRPGPDAPPPVISAFQRGVLASLGVFFVGVAAVGAFLPGIPTVGPLILASILLTKSFPRLEQRLIRNRLFARYLPYLDGTVEMSYPAKLAAIATMWTSISISAAIFCLASSRPFLWLGGLLVAGLIGTVFILRFGRRKLD